MRRIFGHYVAVPTFMLGAFEGLLVAAGCMTLAYFYGFAKISFASEGLAALPMTLFMTVVVVGLMHWGGLYEADALLNLRRATWRLSLIAVPIFLFAIWATGKLAKSSVIPIYPYRWQWTIALTIVWLVSAIAVRALYWKIHKTGWLTRRILVVGDTKYAAEFSDLSLETNCEFLPASCVEPVSGGSSPENSLPLRSHLIALAAENGVSEIVVGWGTEDILSRQIHTDCGLAAINVIDFPDFFERESGRLYIEALNNDWILRSRGIDVASKQARFKRAFDVVFAAVAIVATAPVMAMTALAIKLEDRGRILYTQERVGLGGRNFMVLKFRSMREDAENDGIPAWAAERDSRITRVGRIIRKLRIDELPQFFNVLRGEMAIIGPRPERPYFVNRFVECIPFYSDRHVLRPGITGWAQVKFRYGASLDDTRRKLSYDLYYVKNQGVLLDLIILLKTIGVVLRGEGAR